MVEWLKNFVANFDLGDLFAIIGTLFSSGIGLWALRIYKSYKLLKDKSVDEIVRSAMSEANEQNYDKIQAFMDSKLIELDDKISQVNTNVVLNTISKATESERITAMINNSNLVGEKKTEVEQVVADEVKTEEKEKEERINELDAM